MAGVGGGAGCKVFKEALLEIQLSQNICVRCLP